MRKIKTVFGDLYIEELNDRAEQDFIKIYDSNERYLHTLEVDTFQQMAEKENYSSIEPIYNWFISVLEMKFNSIEDMFDFIGIDYEFYTADLTNAYEYMISNGYFYDDEIEKIKKAEKNNDLTDDFIISNDWSNVIGSTYLIIRE